MPAGVTDGKKAAGLGRDRQPGASGDVPADAVRIVFRTSKAVIGFLTQSLVATQTAHPPINPAVTASIR